MTESLAQQILRRALTNSARMLEEEARRRRHVFLGGSHELDEHAKLIRVNLDTLCSIEVDRCGTQS